MVQLALVLLLRRSRVLRLLFPAALSLLAGACIWVFGSVRVDAVGLNADSVAIQTPVKAHLRDGSTVLYRTGVLLARDTLRGPGVRYALTLRDSTTVVLVPHDSIVAMESYRRGTDVATTAIVSTLATGVTFAATVVVAFLISCASQNGICSNCPTVYTDSAGSDVLQAEGFSYTIGSASETRDVDRLGIGPDRDGRIRLEVRNDAFETEYLNHLELLEVRHAAEEIALPDPNGAALAVRELVPATTAADAAGRDLRLLLARSDGTAFRTDPRTLAGVSPADWDDAIYLAAPATAGRDSVALVLRLRNSLLATLLYTDVVLGDRGARSLDWIGRDLDGGGAALARWQEQRLGLRVATWDGRRYREIARIRDSGPHAWNDVAVLIPVLQRDSVRVRLSFAADNWRIDRIAFAMRARRPGVQAHAVRRLRDADGHDDPSALASIRLADRRYLRTSPGERFSVDVMVGPAGMEVARTFLIATQGYYEPWIGHDGLRTARDSGVVDSLDDELLKALRKWSTVREARERAFAAHAASLAEMRGR
jgi:hypothetical protein